MALDLITRRIETAKKPLHQQQEFDRLFQEEVDNFPQDYEASRYLLSSIGQFSRIMQTKHANLRCLDVLLATERYQLAQGDWPNSLEDLTPRFLAKIPLDPMDGKPLRFKRVGDGFVVYSVYPDGVDRGGFLSRLDENAPKGAKCGFQLWPERDRGKPPSPRPPKRPIEDRRDGEP